MVLETLVKNNILKYGNFKSKTGKKMDYIIDPDELFSQSYLHNYFSKKIYSLINHYNYDGLLALDDFSLLIAGLMGGNYNQSVMFLKGNRVLGSKKVKRIVIITSSSSKKTLEQIELVKRLGFELELTVILFERNKETIDLFIPVISYQTIIRYKSISFFLYNAEKMNVMGKRVSKAIEEKQVCYCKTYKTINDFKKYPVILFKKEMIDESLLQKINQFNNPKILFKIFNCEQKEFFQEILELYKYIDIYIIHIDAFINLVKIVKKLPNNKGVIIYCKDNDDIDTVREYYKNEKETIVGTINLEEVFEPLINYSRDLRFVE